MIRRAALPVPPMRPASAPARNPIPIKKAEKRQEKKKKPKPETPKKVEKKPKIMLMPCMSHKKNDDATKEKKRDNSESVVKKIRLI